MEGSSTLHHWSRLATPHLGSLLEERPGVATRETEHDAAVKYSRDFLVEMYSLLDVEEDEEEMQLPGKSFDLAPPVFTYTNSTVLHPDELTRVTSSLQGACISAVNYHSGTNDSSPDTTMDSGLVLSHLSRRNSGVCTTTFSTQMALAKALQERVPSVGGEYGSTFSGLSTPNNSPDWTPPGTPPNGFMGPMDLLQKGAKMIRRTLTGIETPCPRPRRVPRISRRELEDLSKLNLMAKLEKLGLNEVRPRDAAVSPEALQLALEHLSAVQTFENQDKALNEGEGRTSTGKSTPSSSSVKLSRGAEAANGLNAIAQLEAAPLASKAVSSAQVRASFHQRILTDASDGQPRHGVAPGCRSDASHPEGCRI